MAKKKARRNEELPSCSEAEAAVHTKQQGDTFYIYVTPERMTSGNKPRPTLVLFLGVFLASYSLFPISLWLLENILEGSRLQTVLRTAIYESVPRLVAGALQLLVAVCLGYVLLHRPAASREL